MALGVQNYGSPAYGARLNLSAAIAAGSGAQSVPKFVAHANLLAFALNSYQTVAGTSTYTNTVTGVGTATVAAQQLSLIVITNTASAGATAALSTTTIGPFISGGGFVGGGTGTGQVGGVVQYALNTQTASVGQSYPQNQGGIPIPQGSLFYVVAGTDATATEAISLDVQIAVGAPLTL